MSVRITIEARDKGTAQLLAQHLPVEGRVSAWRGLGVIRLEARDAAEATGIVSVVSAWPKRFGLGWVRVRYGDESRVFRSNGRNAALDAPAGD